MYFGVYSDNISLWWLAPCNTKGGEFASWVSSPAEETRSFKCFLFSPLPEEMIQFDEHFFQMGSNHQLVVLLWFFVVRIIWGDCWWIVSCCISFALKPPHISRSILYLRNTRELKLHFCKHHTHINTASPAKNKQRETHDVRFHPGWCTCSVKFELHLLVVSTFYEMTIQVHPGRSTCNLKMMVWKIIFLSKWVIFRFHVILPGCTREGYGISWVVHPPRSNSSIFRQLSDLLQLKLLWAHPVKRDESTTKTEGL